MCLSQQQLLYDSGFTLKGHDVIAICRPCFCAGGTKILSVPVSSSFHMTSMRVMTLRVWPLTDLKRCASSAIMVFHLMPTNTELSLSTVSYEVCTKDSIDK